MGLKFRRFAFVAYAIGYGYAAISYQVLSEVNDVIPALIYLASTGIAVVVWMTRLARRLTTEE
jgi:hypothetical protein